MLSWLLVVVKLHFVVLFSPLHRLMAAWASCSLFGMPPVALFVIKLETSEVSSLVWVTRGKNRVTLWLQINKLSKCIRQTFSYSLYGITSRTSLRNICCCSLSPIRIITIKGSSSWYDNLLIITQYYVLIGTLEAGVSAATAQWIGRVFPNQALRCSSLDVCGRLSVVLYLS